MSPTIKWKTLSTQEFWLPSRIEQKKIAQILWTVESNIERLEKLIQIVTFDRIKLAFSLYTCAKKLDTQSDKQNGDYRSIISRCYYCHYHLARAVIFFITRDDIDDHKELPKGLGKVLPSE